MDLIQLADEVNGQGFPITSCLQTLLESFRKTVSDLRGGFIIYYIPILGVLNLIKLKSYQKGHFDFGDIGLVRAIFQLGQLGLHRERLGWGGGIRAPAEFEAKGGDPNAGIPE